MLIIPSFPEKCSLICRIRQIKTFAAQHELVVFVGGHDSSNAKALFEMCRQVNAKSYFIESIDELKPEWFNGVKSVGISGATSTPSWLIMDVKATIEKMFLLILFLKFEIDSWLVQF